MNPSIHTAQVLPARAVLFLGIVALHGLFAYVFASGLLATTYHILRADPPIEVIPLKNPTPPPAPPHTLPPQLITQIAIEDPLPVGPINMESENAITLAATSPAPSGPIVDTPPAPLPIRLAGPNIMPNTADYYPPAEIRMGNEGTAEIQSCVDTSGRLDGTPTVEATSGHAPLDKAAVRLAKDGKYARAFRGDMPVPNCYRFRVTFTLH
jgi:periplasmic protein TonB